MGSASKVFVNGEEYETYFVGDTMLLIYSEDMNSLDVITVAQKSASTILTTTEPYTYFKVEEYLEENETE